jgi:hypothetical protein
MRVYFENNLLCGGFFQVLNARRRTFVTGYADGFVVYTFVIDGLG